MTHGWKKGDRVRTWLGTGVVRGFLDMELLDPETQAELLRAGVRNGFAYVQYDKKGQWVNPAYFSAAEDIVAEIGDYGVMLEDGTELSYATLALIMSELTGATLKCVPGYRKQPTFVLDHLSSHFKEAGRLLMGASPEPVGLV